MRARTILTVVAILIVAGFVALNWTEFVRPTQLNFGGGIVDAPIGLVMLAILTAVVILFLLAGAVQRTHSLVEARQHHRTLEQQRELADKAEASRFTELRTYFDQQLREIRDRDALLRTEYEKSALGSQRDLRSYLDQMSRSLAARLDAMEDRLDGRPVRNVPPRADLRADLRTDLRTEEALRNDPLRGADPLRTDPVPPDRIGRERV
jgi:DNA anti-recombination protein RmuC